MSPYLSGMLSGAVFIVLVLFWERVLGAMLDSIKRGRADEVLAMLVMIFVGGMIVELLRRRLQR